MRAFALDWRHAATELVRRISLENARLYRDGPCPHGPAHRRTHPDAGGVFHRHRFHNH